MANTYGNNLKLSIFGGSHDPEIGMTLTGSKVNGFAEEKAAAKFLNDLGVLFNVWPTAQTKPDGEKNVAVFNEGNVSIIKVEKIDVELKSGKWIMVSREEVKG